METVKLKTLTSEERTRRRGERRHTHMTTPLRPLDLDSRPSPYPMDLEDASEAARLTIVHRVLAQQFDELVPPPLVHRPDMQVLDVGCGPGGWVHDVAYS